MPKPVSIARSKGAIAFVVQDEFETMRASPNDVSLAPRTMVISANSEGPEMRTVLAPAFSPRSALSRDLTCPVHSKKTSALGKLALVRKCDDENGMNLLSTRRPVLSAETSQGRGPNVLSYLKRYAQVSS